MRRIVIGTAQTAAIAEQLRDKQNDDWSRYAGFGIDFVQPFLGGNQRYRVVANGCVPVGTYDSYATASIVKAKLEYRRKEPIRGMIGLDGLAA